MRNLLPALRPKYHYHPLKRFEMAIICWVLVQGAVERRTSAMKTTFLGYRAYQQSKQHQSDTDTAPKQNQSSTKETSKKHRSSASLKRPRRTISSPLVFHEAKRSPVKPAQDLKSNNNIRPLNQYHQVSRSDQHQSDMASRSSESCRETASSSSDSSTALPFSAVSSVATVDDFFSAPASQPLAGELSPSLSPALALSWRFLRPCAVRRAGGRLPKKAW